MEKKWKSYSSEVDFLFETGNFQVKLAQSSQELRKLFRLRHKVFIQEWGNTRIPLPLLEVDPYDWSYDHLIVTTNESTKPVIATCRLKLVKDYKNCYTGKYYSLASFFNTFPGNKVEMGRLCVDASFRKLSALFLIWRGLTHYLSHTNADYLFGVSSVPSSPEKFMENAQDIYQYFKEKNNLDTKLHVPIRALSSEFYKIIQPKKNPITEEKEKNGKQQTDEKIKNCIPPLLHFYLGQGAKICSIPCWDAHFNCIDFFHCFR